MFTVFMIVFQCKTSRFNFSPKKEEGINLLLQVLVLMFVGLGLISVVYYMN